MAFVFGALILLGLESLVRATQLPNPRLATSTLVLDRHGRLLRPFPVDGGRWRLPVALDEVDPRYLSLLLFVEDRRFYAHAGVEARALLRAAWQLMTAGRVVSGGSTLTMQLVRLLDGRPTRRLSAKLRQIRVALALERTLDKESILASYLTLAPYGGNLQGVRAASLAWFGKEPRRLSAAEAALLVALPQAPESRRPDRHPAAARRARDRVLERAHRAGLIDAIEFAAARQEPLPSRRRSFPMLAAHLARGRRQAHPGMAVQRLTIDARLQGRLEHLAAERAPALGDRVSVAMLVANHASGEVLASVGSAGLFDAGRGGFVDMTRAVRSPGSTLKPLIYGLAFEDGVAHPESLIEDRPTGFEGYAPTNFHQDFQGTVTVRRALQGSLNVPAVKLLAAVGPARLMARLRRAGANPILPDAASLGLAVGLGGVGLTLMDLVRLYGAIARGGTALELRVGGSPRSNPGLAGGQPGVRVLEGRAAWHVASILAGAPTPAYALAGDLAFKTGTSYGYRDAWAIGFDGRHVVGVWVGRPDGAPVPGLVGIEGAAPILFDVFARLGRRVPLPAAPPGILTSSTADLPPSMRRVRSSSRWETPGSTENAPQIAYPPPGARVDLGLRAGRVAELALEVRGGRPPFQWFVNGVPLCREPYARAARWRPDGPGYATLLVVDGLGVAARTRVLLD